MKRSIPILVLAALLAVARGAAAAPVAAADVELLGIDPALFVATDSQGRRLASGVAEDPPPGLTVTGGGESALFLQALHGESYRFEFRTGADPFTIVVRDRLGDEVSRIVRFESGALAAERLVELRLEESGAATLRWDGDGNGSAETSIPPVASLEGAAAADRTPPVVEHTRRADGRHELRLLDGETDVTSPARLVYSLDGGTHFVPYTGPIALDPRETPTLWASGRDDAGNTSQRYAFPTAAPFCDRVAADQAALRSLARDALTAATAQGHLPADPGVALLAEGDAACLWRADACSACEGVYAPATSDVAIALLFPESVGAASRSAVAALFAAEAEERSSALPSVSFSVESRADFEAARVALDPASPADDGGLARGLRLLARSLLGEWMDLGAGAPDVAGASLDGVATALRSAGLSRAEGFEAALLGDLRQLRGGVLLRIVGATRGATADAPERDSYENRVARSQLETAAHALANASLGLLASDPCGAENAFAFRTRAQARADACGGAACRSFEAYAAARVAASRATCADLFSDAEAADLAQAARIADGDVAELAALFADECSANAFLGRALRTVRALRERAAASHQAALAAATPSERASREANAAAAQTSLAELGETATQNVRLRVVNSGATPVTGAVLRAYEDGEPGQTRTLDVPPDTALVVQGDAAHDVPFFLRRTLAGATPNEVRAVVYVLEPGAGAAPSAGTRVAGLGSYVFDPANAICPQPAETFTPPDVEGGP